MKQPSKGKKIIYIIAAIIVLGIIAIFVIKNYPELIIIDKELVVTKDDNFKGPLEPNSPPQDNDRIFNSLAVSPANPDIVYVGTESNAIFKTIDGGKTWEWLRTGLWHNFRGYPEVYDLIIDPDNENNIYTVFTNGAQPPDVGKAGGFYKSTDAGETWERSIEGLPNTGATAVALKDDRIFLALNGEKSSTYHIIEGQSIPGGIYYSDDLGLNWKKTGISEKAVWNKFNKIAVRGDLIYTNGMAWIEKPNKGGMAFDLENSVGLIKSEDNGQTWETISPKGTFPWYYDVSKDGKIIYFSDGNNGVAYKSIDGGVTWQSLQTIFSNTIKISPHNQNTVLFVNGSELHLSKDGMLTSKKVFQGEQDQIINDIEYSSDPNIIYFGTDGYILYKSVDAGETFNEIVNLRTFINNY